MKLIDLYKNILSLASVVSDDEGLLSGVLEDKKYPITVKGKRLVLPTQFQLANFDKSSKVVFHPLNESVVRGTSDVLERYRIMTMSRINQVIGAIFYRLLVVGASVEDHKKLRPEQLDLFRGLKSVNAKTISDFEKLLAAMPVNEPNKGFVSLFLKRGGVINGHKYDRAGIVSFPLYEELSKDRTVYGVNLRSKDRDALRSLFQEIFSDKIDVENSYSRGVDSDIAPFMEALMKTVANLVLTINEVIENNIEILEIDEDKYGKLMFDTSWIESFENIGSLEKEIRMIPMQPGNEGSLPNAAAPVAEVAAPTATTVAAPTVQAAPKAPLPPFASAVGLKVEETPPWETPKTEQAKSNVPEVRSTPALRPLEQLVPAGTMFQQPNQFGISTQPQHPAQFQQMQPMQPMQPMGMMQQPYPQQMQYMQQMGMMQPQMQPQQMPQVRTAGGIDFGAAMMTDPNIAAGVRNNMMQQQAYMQQMAPVQNNRPRWDVSGQMNYNTSYRI